MVELAGRRGFPCRIFSNGLLLDEDLVDRLAAAGLAQITLSLDGSSAAGHDRLRGWRAASTRYGGRWGSCGRPWPQGEGRSPCPP